MNKKLTLKQYFGLNEIIYSDIKELTSNTIGNIMRGGHDGAKYNPDYKGRLPYYPTDKTVLGLAKGLGISEKETRTLIDNQLKSIKKNLENTKK